MVADKNSKINYGKEYANLLQAKFKESKNHGPKIGKRHIQTVLLFLLTFVFFLERNSISVILVAITDSEASVNKDIPTYNWTNKNIIMTSQLWGSMISHVGAGYIVTLYGAKWFLTGALLANSVLGLFIPITAAILGSKGFIAIRILQGVAMSFLFPSIHMFLAKWVPLQERSRLGTFVYMGPAVGSILSIMTSGYIASSWYGWPMVLYISSGLGLIVCAVFGWYGCDSPNKHTTITEDEKYYIITNITEDGTQSKKDIPIPWLQICSSLPFWALISANVGFLWINTTLFFETPIYMNRIMKFDLKSNGVVSALPNVAEVTFTMLYGCIADHLITKKILSIGNTRKLMNIYGMALPTISLILLAQCNSDNTYKAVLYLIIVGATCCSTKSGYNVNHLDLSPNFAGILMGICETLVTTIVSLTTVVVQLLVTDENDASQWKLVFYIAAAVSLGCLIINVIFGSGSVQPWNEGSKKYKEKYQDIA